MKLEVLNRYHPLRADVEHYIKNQYQIIFGATIKTFPSILIALVENHNIKAACGMRTVIVFRIIWTIQQSQVNQ